MRTRRAHPAVTLFISACKEDTSLSEEITNKYITRGGSEAESAARTLAHPSLPSVQEEPLSKDKVSTNPVNKNSSNNPGEGDKFNE